MLTAFLHEINQPTFWLSISKVIWIDALLSGDNALVIAMACRGLSPRHKVMAMILGTGAAVGFRIGFTSTIAALMTVPYLKLVGGAALVYVAAKMCADDSGGADVETKGGLLAAVAAIIVADLMMSLDNMIAVAAVAQGSVLILGLGLAISIPMIVVGATAITFVLGRFPALVWAGAGLLGWISGELVASDPIATHMMPMWMYGTFGVIAVGMLFCFLKAIEALRVPA